MDVAATHDKAMARTLRSTRFAGSSRISWPTDAEIDRDLGDYERYSIRDDEGLAEAARLDEDADRTLTGEVPAGYDPRCFGKGEW